MLYSLTAFVLAGPLPPPVTQPLTSVGTAADWLPALAAGLLGAALTRAWSVRRAVPTPGVVRLGRAAGFRPFGPDLPGTGDGPSVWCAAEDGLAEDLAAALAVRGPVLLLLRPDRRAAAWSRFGAGVLPVWLPEEERPSPRRALAALQRFGQDGQAPVVVVDGVNALEAVVGGRSSAAVEELLRASAVPVFAVLRAGEAAPAGPWKAVHVAREAASWRPALPAAP